MFFPTNPEWFHLGSHDAPLARDVRQLAPFVEWSSPLGNAALRSRNPRNTVKAQQVGSPHHGGKEDLQKVIKTMTGGVRSGAHQSTEGNRREKSPRDDNVEDLRDVIDGLRHKGRSQPKDRSGSRGRDEPSSRGTDPNEHRTRRHKYDTDLPPDRKHNQETGQSGR